MHEQKEQQTVQRTQRFRKPGVALSKQCIESKRLGFLHATEHVITFYSFGNLPRRYSRESKGYLGRLASSTCSGFQKSSFSEKLPEP